MSATPTSVTAGAGSEPTVEPHIVLRVAVDGSWAAALIDSAANSCFISSSFAHRHSLPLTPLNTLLALNILLLSSSPLRGQALALMKFRNSTLGTLRNIFLDKVTRQIAIDTTNLSKERDSRVETKSNIRFLPRRVSTVVVYYIWLVVPLVEYLSMRYLDKEVMETRLFAGPARDVAVNHLTRALGRFFLKTFKARLTLVDYRHLITYIIKQWIVKDGVNLLSPRVKRTMQLTKGGAPPPHGIEDQLAGRTTSMANRFYARDKNLFLLVHSAGDRSAVGSSLSGYWITRRYGAFANRVCCSRGPLAADTRSYCPCV